MKNTDSPRKRHVVKGYLKIALIVVAGLTAYFAITHRSGGVMVMALVAGGLIVEFYTIKKAEKQETVKSQQANPSHPPSITQ